MMLMADNGMLTAEGIAFLRRTEQVRLDNADIQRIFNPSAWLERGENALRNTWRERVVSEEVKLHMQVQPVRLSRGSLVAGGRPTPGLFATADRSRIVFVNRELTTVFRWIMEIAAIGVPEAIFHLGSPASDSRAWSVPAFLAYALRAGRDPEFATTYEETHVHYLSQRFTDPLQMIPPGSIDNGGLRRVPMTLQQFWGLGDERLDAGSTREFREGLPPVGNQVQTGAREWFRFLFRDFVGDINSDRLRAALGDARSQCLGLTERDGVKFIGPKRPDVIQIYVGDRRVEVLDATLRVLTKWHNFKTACYATVLRMILSNATPAWGVVPFDFRDTRRMMAP